MLRLGQSTCSGFETPHSFGPLDPVPSSSPYICAEVPYHRIVCDVPEPIQAAETINQWLDYNDTARNEPGGLKRSSEHLDE